LVQNKKSPVQVKVLGGAGFPPPTGVFSARVATKGVSCPRVKKCANGEKARIENAELIEVGVLEVL
jgi:hypothetical protein